MSVKIKRDCLDAAIEITKEYAASPVEEKEPLAAVLEDLYKKLLELRGDVEKEEK